ncbi:hypothetical protein MMU07_21275 [Aquiflexum sp. LQ15W]|uniref:hypothetical protein n=1 Tax=Cognataquiflexum nitidum TaxID=2922272 RepID=UPI001F131135|nr:hypothetical protein [Cognataquiflexum nitidum]MCH6202123.1 hypothetical protein [Cognataquiflexum nitidum]
MIKTLLKDSVFHVQYWYMKELIRAKKLKKPLANLLKYYVPYMKSNMDYSKTPLIAGVPWITFEAIDFLKGIVKPEMKVFEYGSGGSTKFFAERVAEIHSVEHDELWYNMVKTKLVDCPNLHLNLMKGEEKPFDEVGFISDEDDDPLDYRGYSGTILDFEDQYFDMVLVDGKARNGCILNSVDKLKKGGFLIVDNSNRKSYSTSIDKLDSWLFLQSFGPSVNSKRFTQTSFFKKP